MSFCSSCPSLKRKQVLRFSSSLRARYSPDEVERFCSHPSHLFVSSSADDLFRLEPCPHFLSEPSGLLSQVGVVRA